MRFFLILAGLFSLLTMDIGACSGECIACHPKLIKKDGKMDDNHKILNRCKNCHRDGTKIEMLDSNQSDRAKFNIVNVKDLNESTHTECGSDCWQCHDIKEVSKINIAEHKVLKKCIECHISVDKSLLGTESPSLDNTLKDLLKGE